METLSGRYNVSAHCGIGIVVKDQSSRAGYVGHLIAPINSFSQTPAQRAGLTEGDLLLRISTAQGLITPVTANDFNNNLRGPQGSRLELEVLRQGSTTPERLTLTRDIILPRGRNAWQGAIPYIVLDADHRCLMQLSASPTPPPATQQAASALSRG